MKNHINTLKLTTKIKLYALIIAFIIACGESKTVNPIKPSQPQPEPYQTISQYKSRDFDGKKRAGIFYEVFVRSFADSNGDGIGDLKGLTAKLDYLNELGIAGIWLMPINPSPSYHGYDVED